MSISRRTALIAGGVAAGVALIASWLATGAAGNSQAPELAREKRAEPAESASPSELDVIETELERNPARALELAQRAETHMAETARDEQRRWLVIRALVRLNRLGEARAAARDYLQRHPDGRLRGQIESYTGVRLRPSGPAP